MLIGLFCLLDGTDVRWLLLNHSSSNLHRELSWNDYVTQLIDLGVINFMILACIVRIFWYLLLYNLFFDIVSFGFLFIFNSCCVHIVLGKMSKFCTNKKSLCRMSFFSCDFSHNFFLCVQTHHNSDIYTMYCNPIQIFLSQIVLLGSTSWFFTLNILILISCNYDTFIQI